MRVFRPLSTFERGQLHRVIVRHAISDQPIESLDAELVDAPPEWSVAVVNGDVLVAGPLDADPPVATPQIRLTVGRPYADYLELDDADTLAVTLDAPEIERTVEPVRQQVEVRLRTADGDPNVGQVVTVHAATSSSSRTTFEVQPGVYKTALADDPELVDNPEPGDDAARFNHADLPDETSFRDFDGPAPFTPSWRRFIVRVNGDQIGSSTQLQTYRTTTAVTVDEP